MLLRKWEELPENMRNESVRPYYDALKRRTGSLVLKRIFDIVVSFLLLIVVSPFLLLIALAVKVDSRGPVFFRQVRITTYGRQFRIWKFRTMVDHAEKMGTQVTTGHDARITRMGRLLRGCRLDELPQLINILTGDMSFVGTRPEVPKYVERYTDEMRATLLLPAGVTSEASIRYKDEAQLLNASDDVDKVYVEKVLHGKMEYNLDSLRDFSFMRDIRTMMRTVAAVLGKNYA